MTTYPLNHVLVLDMISNNSFGEPTDADSTPTFAVYEDTTDTDMGFGGNMTKRTSLTGHYRASFTCSAANGFELGKNYVVVATSTVNSLSSKTIIGKFRLTAAEASTGVPYAAIASNIKKNQELANFVFVMTDSTNHAPLTGATVTAERSIDGATFASCSNSVSEVAHGVYKISLSAADLNGNNIMLRFTASGADDRLISITTMP